MGSNGHSVVAGRLSVADMAKPGIILNLVGVTLTSFFVLTYGSFVFDISLSGQPDWARACANATAC